MATAELQPPPQLKLTGNVADNCRKLLQPQEKTLQWKDIHST